MTRFQYLKASKTLLRSIVKQRRYLQAHSASKLPDDYVKEALANMENAISQIKTPERMHVYLKKNQSEILDLITPNTKKWRKQLKGFIKTEKEMNKGPVWTQATLQMGQAKAYHFNN